MITFISSKTIGMNELIEEHNIDIRILNSENIKDGDRVFIANDGINLDTKIKSSKFKQIIGYYKHPNKVILHYSINFKCGVDIELKNYTVHYLK